MMDIIWQVALTVAAFVLLAWGTVLLAGNSRKLTPAEVDARRRQYDHPHRSSTRIGRNDLHARRRGVMRLGTPTVPHQRHRLNPMTEKRNPAQVKAAVRQQIAGK